MSFLPAFSTWISRYLLRADRAAWPLPHAGSASVLICVSSPRATSNYLKISQEGAEAVAATASRML